MSPHLLADRCLGYGILWFLLLVIAHTSYQLGSMLTNSLKLPPHQDLHVHMGYRQAYYLLEATNYFPDYHLGCYI